MRSISADLVVMKRLDVIKSCAMVFCEAVVLQLPFCVDVPERWLIDGENADGC